VAVVAVVFRELTAIAVVLEAQAVVAATLN
jgi:hypothetical protein